MTADVLGRASLRNPLGLIVVRLWARRSSSKHMIHLGARRAVWRDAFLALLP